MDGDRRIVNADFKIGFGHIFPGCMFRILAAVGFRRLILLWSPTTGAM